MITARELRELISDIEDCFDTVDVEVDLSHITDRIDEIGAEVGAADCDCEDRKRILRACDNADRAVLNVSPSATIDRSAAASVRSRLNRLLADLEHAELHASLGAKD